MSTYSLLTYFHIDRLAAIMMGLVGLIGFVVMLFSSRYMQGDRLYFRFMGLLGVLILTVMAMVASDQLYLTWVLWVVSNLLLVLLMVHKVEWLAAYHSGKLAAKTFTIGAISLALSFAILHAQTGETSIQQIIAKQHPNDEGMILAIILMIVAAMTQSAIFPFHRWLLSSLNSPTPVSAMMHAGLVNGGGILLVRFSSLIHSNSLMMNLLFILGVFTALLGTLWKLMQHDVKRMLACSTMGQMGYMLAQCGLGLFPAAIAHICFHGLFKANLFLCSPAAAHEKRINQTQPSSLVSMILATIGGLLGSYYFALGLHQSWFINDTRFFLIGMAFIVAFEVTITLIQRLGVTRFPIVIIATSAIDYFYGYSVYLIDLYLGQNQLVQSHQINFINLLGMILLLVMWAMMFFVHRWNQAKQAPAFVLKWYVKMLNQSQPLPSTITACRNQYQY